MPMAIATVSAATTILVLETSATMEMVIVATVTVIQMARQAVVARDRGWWQ